MKHVSDTNPKDESGETPLHYAADFGHLRLFKFIMEHAIHKNPPNDYGDTPLHLTAFGDPQLLGGSIGSTEEKLQICQFIIENVADIDPVNEDGKTPLDYAREEKSLNIVQLLEQELEKRNTCSKKVGSNYENKL